MKTPTEKSRNKGLHRNRRNKLAILSQKSTLTQFNLRLEPLEERRMLAFTATLAGNTATFVGDASADTLTFDSSGGLLRHNRAGDAGFNSAFDFNSAVAGDQTLAVSATSIISIDTGTGSDIVNIGTVSVAASSLLATFNYNNGGAGDTFLVDDGFSGAPKTYSVGSAAITATGINITTLTTITGGKTLRTSSAVDTINITTTAANEALSITTSGGADNINIGGVNGVQNISATVSISNPSSRSNVTVDNTGDATGRTANISETGITVGFAPAAINITSNDVASFIVRGGSAADTFNVTPTTFSSLAFNIQGAAPTTSPGDVLSLNLTGVTGASLVSPTAGSGTYSFTNRTSVSYSQIERVTSGGTGTFTVGAINTGAGNDTINLSRSGGDIVLTVGGAERLRTDLASVAGGLAINGEGGNDTFTVDFAGGNPIPAGNVTFDGGAGGNDAMVLTGGAANTLRHFFTNANDGRAEFDGDVTDDGGAAETQIAYFGLDPITDNMNVVNRVFTFNNGADVATLGDDPTPGNNMLRISTTNVSSETVDFTTPTATLTVNMDNGGTGNDTLAIGAFDSASVISTSVTVNGGTGTDVITSNITGPSGLVPAINLNGGDDADEIRVWAMPAQGGLAALINTNVNTGNGAPGDRTIIGANATFANFNTGVGTLAAILGNVNVADSGTVGEVYIDDSADVIARTFTFAATAAVPVFGGPGLNLSSALLPGIISATDDMTVYQFAAGTGNDTLNINNSLDGFAAANTVASSFFGNAGNDTFTIAGDGLADNNTISGGNDNDAFNLNITTNIGASTNGINSLTLQGDAGLGGAASSSINRDRITINDNSAASRSLNYHYIATSAGDLNIEPTAAGSGLFGAANLNLQIRTMETVVFNAASNNDAVRVTGTTSDDVLTVALRNNNTSAIVFRDGSPYLNAPPATIANSRPGVSGGGAGPDLLLNGITSGAGITLFGGDAVPGGDRAVVYAASENNLIDVGNPTDIFGFGAGVLQPGFGVGSAYDTLAVSDNAVSTSNNSFGALTPVLLNTADFVQAGPPAGQAAGLTVNGGDEALPQANDRADLFDVTGSTNFHIQVNGNLPNLTVGVNGQPQGDELNLTFVGAINVYSDAANPPNVTVTGVPAISGPFGVKFSSIERTFLTPGNGVVNIIGDNNDAAGPAQNDVFVVRGMDVDFDPNIPINGQNEFSLQLGGDKIVPGGPVNLSSPIFFRGVTRINASGGEAVAFDPNGNAVPAIIGTGVDTLDITAYADNTPRGWGIETFFNEGDPVLDGDLLVYNGVLGVSDGIVVQPSTLEGGQVFSTNLATNTPIAVVNYTLNTAIIVNGNNGLAGDTDTLTLRGLNPDPANVVTGNDHVTANFTAAGDAANPLVTFRDNGPAGLIVYELQNFSGLNTINFELLAGSDTLLLTGRNDGSLKVNVDGGNDAVNDFVGFLGTAGAGDAFAVHQGSANNSATVLADRAPAAAQTHVNVTRMETLAFDGLGGAGSDSLAVFGTDASNVFTVQTSSAFAGLIGVDNFPNLSYLNFGTGAGGGFSSVNLSGDAFGGVAQSGNDTVRFVGTTVADAFAYTPSTNDTAALRMVSGGGTIDFNILKIESASLDGAFPTAGAGDTLTVPVTNALVTPGSTSGSGTITAMNAGGQGLLPLSFTNMEGSTITGGTVVVDGTQYDDIITVSAAGVVTVADHNGVVINTFNLAGAGALVINGLSGNDTINVSPSALFAGGISIFGGEPSSGSDAVVVSGATPTINFAANQVTGIVGGAITLQGIESLTVNGTDGVLNAVTISGYGSTTDVKTLNLNTGDSNNNDGDTIDVTTTAGPDTIRYTPLSGSSARMERIEGGPVINISGFNNTDNNLTLDASGNIDGVQVIGPVGNDLIQVIQGGVGTRATVIANGNPSGGVKWVPLDFTSVNSLALDGGLGNDRFDIDNSAGLVSLASGISVDGNVGNDSLRLIGTTAITTSTYSVGPAITSGSVVHALAATLQQVFFTNLEPVVDLVVAASLVVNGTNANNAINYTQGGGAANGLVSIDGFETIEFSNKTSLVINALAGADTINLSHPGTPTALTGITVNGGDPGGLDTIIYTGTTATETFEYQPSGTDGGTLLTTGRPNVTFDEIEAVTIDGRSDLNDDTLILRTEAGFDVVTLAPGANVDSGVFHINATAGSEAPPSLTFRALGQDSFIELLSGAGGSREDAFEYRGTGVTDTFNVTPANGGTINLNIRKEVRASGINSLSLQGLEGDDIFNLTGALPFTNTVIDGGSPSASDVVNLTAATGAVTIDLAALTVTGYGGTVSLIGVETLNATAGANTVTVLGTAGPDDLSVTPTSSTAATMRLAGLNLVVNTSNTAALNIELLGGGDHLTVNGTQNSETLTVNSTTVVATTTGFKTVTYSAATTEFLQINALAGNDIIDVTPSATTSIFVDGGDPIGSNPGDRIVLHPPGAFVLEPGPENDEGGLNSAGAQRVSWDHIEGVFIVGGGPGVILGTNGDDDITVIARDSSTHVGTNGVQDFTVTVNDGPEFLFIDQPFLFIDALAGDDDIVVREPAPNNAVWNVQIFVAGGPPAAPTVDQGDVLELETQGTSQNVIYTPQPAAIAAPGGVVIPVPGPDTATFNDTTNTSIIAATSFSIPILGFVSSPGGIERAIYHGGSGGVLTSDALTVAATTGSDIINFTPGSTRDSGSVQVNSLIPLFFENIGTIGTVAFTDAGGVDSLVYNGSSSVDIFGINATTGVLTLTNSVGGHVNATVPTAGNLIESLAINALDGDDQFNVTAGPLFAFGIVLSGGNPSGSDIATLNGTAANDVIGLTLDIAGDTVTGVVGGPIVLISTEVLNLNALAGNDAITVNNVGGLSDLHNVIINSGANATDTLVVNGTVDDDIITYTPTGAGSGDFSEAEGQTQFSFVLGTAASSTFTINGLTSDADEVIVQGTNNHDVITIDSPGRIVTVENAAGTVLKPVILDASIEEVTALGRLGNDTFLVIPSPGIPFGIPVGSPGFTLPHNLLVYVDGGQPGASDALVVAGPNGIALPADRFVVVNRGRNPGEGVVRVFQDQPGAGNEPFQFPDIIYTEVEVVSPVPFINANGDPQLLILGPDNYEPNEFRTNAAFIGSGSSINVTNLAIFPNAFEHRFVVADNDWYRFTAQYTGTLDIQVYFQQIPEFLPGQGNLEIEVRDASGDLITGFGANDNTDDERSRIPVVAGQTYYLRVFGALPTTTNAFNMTIINTPPPVPFDLELDDVVGSGAALAGGAANSFTANIVDAIAGQPGLNASNNYYVGTDPKLVTFTSGNLAGQRHEIATYTVVAGIATFTFATPFTAAPTAGSRFVVESVDTGRSQLDNTTHDNRPTIFLRLDDGIFLNDLPGNDVTDTPPDEVIPIPFSPTGATPGYRIAIFDEGNTPPQSGTAPQTPVGFAVPVPGQQGVYSFTFPSNLSDGSHFITARVQMVDPALPSQNGLGGRSLSLEIVVDTLGPPVFFGDPAISNDGLAVDPGVTPQPPTNIDKKTNDRTPTFWGTAEANAIIRLYADLTPDNGIDNFDVLLGLGVASPLDGTNQFPAGQWRITSNIDLNNADFFPLDGVRRILATAEDVAGNINPAGGAFAEALVIFVDTQGPQVTGLFLTDTNLVALSNANSLLLFNSANPTKILDENAITGLQAGDIVVGIDVRPADGLLYAVVNGVASDRIYTVDPLTGAATLVSTLTVNLAGNAFGVDFNPQADRLRIVSDTQQNLRVNVANGVVTVDAALNPAAPNVGAAAYTNNIAGAAFTSLYTIDATTDTLNLQNPPNGGTQVAVGGLGIDVSNLAGFDIAAGTNRAFAALTPGAGLTGLYNIDLVTGGASLLGSIGDGTTQIVGLTALTPFDLFALKPLNADQGPTPPVTSISIGLRDLPTRVLEFLNPAANPDVVINPGHYLLRGDHNGIIPIKSITFVPVPEMPGQIALGTVVIEFFTPLPDDRYTLTMSDSIVDDVGNKLDGENNAIQPLVPEFPTGDGQPGGSFIARFTVDTRPEIGTYAAASIFVDINGNELYDPEGVNNDFTNRDLTFTLGVTNAGGFNGEGFNIHDGLFAGNFANGISGIADGFDKLAAYGFINGHFRWIIDTNNNGVVDPTQGDFFVIQPAVAGFNLSALPFAGDFDPDHPGDEIGLFDGTRFLIDTNGDNVLDAGDLLIVSPLRGAPIVGDFDGDGLEDLATWRVDQFQFDLAADGFGDLDATIAFGFPGVAEQPVAADMDKDGITDVGLFVPRRAGSLPEQLGEWYFLQSNDFSGLTRVTGTVNTLNHPFSPTPLGQDLYAEFGDEFALPIVGNFDPPATTTVTTIAAPVKLGIVQTSSSSSAAATSGDRWFDFQTVRGGTVSIDVTGSPNSQVRLYGPGQQLISTATIGTNGSVEITSPLSASEYSVRIVGSTTATSLAVANEVNLLEAYDVTQDGLVTPHDILLVIDSINRQGVRTIDFTADFVDDLRFDTSLDGQITPHDVLVLIDHVNRQALGGSSSMGLLSTFESSDSAEGPDANEPFVSYSVPADESNAARLASPETSEGVSTPASHSSAPVTSTAQGPSGGYSRAVVSRGRTALSAIDAALAGEDEWGPLL